MLHDKEVLHGEEVLHGQEVLHGEEGVVELFFSITVTLCPSRIHGSPSTGLARVLGEIVRMREDSWKGFQSSSVSCSPRPVSLKLSGTFPSAVGVSMERRGMEKGLGVVEGFWKRGLW